MSLNPIIAGPILRNLSASQMNLWLMSTVNQPILVFLESNNQQCHHQVQAIDECVINTIPIGTHAFVHLISVSLKQPLSVGGRYFYNLKIGAFWASEQSVRLSYFQHGWPSFVYNPQIKTMLHGSCRKPHFDGKDALALVDQLLSKAASSHQTEDAPSMLMFTGDQIYADDVAGPTLHAIQQVIDLLGLYEEPDYILDSQPHSVNNNSFKSLYQRDSWLPEQDTLQNKPFKKLLRGQKKPIFTSVNSHNHLVSCSEVMAMYALVWSPNLWSQIELSSSALTVPQQSLYQQELPIIMDFVASLSKVARVLANIPVYMIFDDHDVTDDWNLTRAWEEAAYGNPLSKRIIGNALIGYAIHQAWGNAPEKIQPLLKDLTASVQNSDSLNRDRLIQQLLDFDQWHYHVDTQPKVLVLDTRTQRWRSESNANKPSGLMDWESLTQLQTKLIGQQQVIMVSAAPVYGVKMIETVQKIFTVFGLALMVDAENWMAHKGTAQVILNIFKHRQTPPNFIILSGDVHYSFVYDITHRFRKNKANILQFTCSGLKNQFPKRLLQLFDNSNSLFYGRFSPFNWLTQRRQMRIKVRHPQKNKRINVYNVSGVGVLRLLGDNQVQTSVINCEGEEIVFAKK